MQLSMERPKKSLWNSPAKPYFHGSKTAFRVKNDQNCAKSPKKSIKKTVQKVKKRPKSKKKTSKKVPKMSQNVQNCQKKSQGRKSQQKK